MASALPPLILGGFVLIVWAFVHAVVRHAIPGPLEVWERAGVLFAHPFRDRNPNDMGIGWQALYSLGRVGAGFGLAVVTGVPLGLMLGMNATLYRAFHPLVQILRPVSPLAWLPIGLLLFRAVNPSAIFVLFITSVWPTLLNTIAGVRAVPKEYLDLAAVLRLGRVKILTHVILPAARPYIISGMRLSLGTAWMVIVAAEMLTGGVGIGFFIWNEWNNLNVASIFVAILLIGIIGVTLDNGMRLVERRCAHGGEGAL
ncbi:MAG: nitrate ABC transporter permease [Acidiferrobacteraceae bacterium]